MNIYLTLLKTASVVLLFIINIKEYQQKPFSGITKRLLIGNELEELELPNKLVSEIGSFEDSTEDSNNKNNDGYNFDINKMLCMVNKERSKANAGPLMLLPKLSQAAKSHCQDQARMEMMSHNGSNGSNVGDRVTNTGYDYNGVAENVAFNQKSVEEVMNAWVHSPGHYKNLINPKYKFFGAAMTDYYWTQVFASGSDGKGAQKAVCS